MKRPYVVLILILFAPALFAQNNAIEIYGTVEGPAADKMKLFFEGEYQKKDSLTADIVDGKFHFKVNRNAPVLARFHMGDPSLIQDVYIDGPKTEIKFTNEIKGEHSLNLLTAVNVTGSSSEKLKQSFEAWLQTLNQSGLPDSVIRLKYFQQLANLIQSNPSSKVGPYLLFKAGSLSLAEVDSLRKMISPSLANSWEVKETQKLIERLTKLQQGVPGNELKDFTLQDTADHSFNISDYRGKYLLIVFWSSWCKPCRAEHPALNSYYSTHKSGQFEILGVSVDSEKAKWLQAIEKDRLTWPQALDPGSAMMKHYGVEFIGLKILVDKTGKILGWNCGLDEVDTLINGNRQP